MANTFKKMFTIFAFLQIESATAKCQIQSDSIVCDVKVINSDSQYYLIPELIMIPKSGIEMPKNRFYVTARNDNSADGILIFQKIIGTTYVNLFVDILRHRPYDKDWDVNEIIKSNSTLNDTLNIANFIPLEPGEYRVMLDLKYWEKGKRKSIVSEWKEFRVYYRPKGSIFFDD